MSASCCTSILSLSPEKCADVLERLCWASDDPGGLLLQAREMWLRSDDRRRVEVALAFDETFPFREHVEMEEVLRRIGHRWPDLVARCEQLTRLRKCTYDGQDC